MGGKKKYIEMFGSFMEPFILSFIQQHEMHVSLSTQTGVNVNDIKGIF